MDSNASCDGSVTAMTSEDTEPIVIVHIDSAPLVDRGCRMVGHAQALVDYAKPLLEKAQTESLAAYNAALTVASCCWKQVATDGTPELYEKCAWPLVEEFFKDENPAALHGMMLERFMKMFPYFENDRDELYIHEAVIDEPPAYEEFDESKFELYPEPISLSPEEVPIAELGEFVNQCQVNDKPVSEYEAEMCVLVEKLGDMFMRWLVQKGISDALADDLAGIAYRFAEFLYDYCDTTYTSISSSIVNEFLDSWFIHKCAFEPGWMSKAPAALCCFFQFLHEKKLADDVMGAAEAVIKKRDDFIANLRLYTDPREKAAKAA